MIDKWSVSYIKIIEWLFTWLDIYVVSSHFLLFEVISLYIFKMIIILYLVHWLAPHLYLYLYVFFSFMLIQANMSILFDDKENQFVSVSYYFCKIVVFPYFILSYFKLFISGRWQNESFFPLYFYYTFFN